MTRYKCSVKDGELTIKSKLGGDEQINPRELELLSGGGIRGVMKVKKGSFGKLIFTAPRAAEALSHERTDQGGVCLGGRAVREGAHGAGQICAADAQS